MDRWSLPGPAGFIAEVVEVLREGANVVLAAPDSAALALSVAIEDRLANEWRLTGPVEASGISPIDEIYAALQIEDGPSPRRSVASLLAGIQTKSLVIVTGVDMPKWPAWQRFVDEYANASRAVAAVDRTQLLVIAGGVPKSRLPSKAPAFRPMIWDGYVGEADVFSYVIQAWRSSGGRIDAQAKLIARIITRLALWDFDLVDRLLALDPRDLFDPCVAIGEAINGNAAYARVGTTWEEGGLAEFDGEVSPHAVALLREGDSKAELPMRLWAAQAAELLPALELNRRHLAKRMKDARVPLPVIVHGMEIYDLLDVEIGPLLWLAKKHRLPQDIVRIAEKYCSLRNKLAHLCPLNADEALDSEVFAPRKRQ